MNNVPLSFPLDYMFPHKFDYNSQEFARNNKHLKPK